MFVSPKVNDAKNRSYILLTQHKVMHFIDKRYPHVLSKKDPIQQNSSSP